MTNVEVIHRCFACNKHVDDADVSSLLHLRKGSGVYLCDNCVILCVHTILIGPRRREFQRKLEKVVA